MLRVGMVGLGIMGKPMAKNILKKGFSLTVSDINQAAVEEVVGCGASAGTYQEVAANCDVILLSLPNAAIVKDVIFGENGLASALKAGTIVCDTSSVSPEDSRECAQRLEKLGVDFVDAPVSGGEPGAINATLSIMCGGKQEAFEKLMPVFQAIGTSALLIGDSGAGSITKLANQIIVNLNITAVGEAMVFAAKAGVDPMKVYQAIRGGLAGSAVLDAKAPMMCAGDFKPGGTIQINHKDIRNVLSAAHAIDAPVPFTAQLFEMQQALKVAGCFKDDHSAYVKYFENLAGVKVSDCCKKED